jgi:hypothetical protein
LIDVPEEGIESLSPSCDHFVWKSHKATCLKALSGVLTRSLSLGWQGFVSGQRLAQQLSCE